MYYEIRSLYLVTCKYSWATFTLKYSNPEAIFTFLYLWILMLYALVSHMKLEKCCFPMTKEWLGWSMLIPYWKKTSMLVVCIAYSSPILFAWRLTPQDVARSWHKNSVEGILSKQPEGRIRILPSPYLCLPLMSIVKIARWVQIPDKICSYLYVIMKCLQLKFKRYLL